VRVPGPSAEPPGGASASAAPASTSAHADGAAAAARSLAARGVSKRYGAVVALDAVSLEVAAGECVALVGESGSGKTTLLRCFNGLVVPDGGEVLVDGQDVRRLDAIALRRATGYVPQEGGLLPHWRVLRNVELVPRLLGSARAAGQAAEALGLVGLAPGDFGRRWPRELSGGQRQRVALARALAARPGVVLLDEPFGALDAITRADLQESFAGLRRLLAPTVVLVTHDLVEAVRLADRIAVMRRARIEQVADARALVERPAGEYVTRLLERAGLVR
jgi:osmoprotectant transport system ATP-binding protein